MKIIPVSHLDIMLGLRSIAIKFIVVAFFISPSLVFAADIVVPSISVTGFAEEKIAPNEASLSLTVHSENKKLDEAKKEQDAKMKSLMQIVEKIGIKTEDVKTLYVNVQPIYDYMQNNKPKFRAYSLDNQIDIKFEKLELAGPLMDKLVEAGFDRVNGLNFGLKNEREQREELLAKALANAKEKAKNMVLALGGKLGKPLTVSESGSYNPPHMMYAKSMRAEAMADAAAPPSMPTYSPAGLIEIQQTVNVTFQIE